MTRITFNRNTLSFVKKFLKSWTYCNLHTVNIQSKKANFRTFIKIMQKSGEYRQKKPSYAACCNFFRNLNPEFWSTYQKKNLSCLESYLSKLFYERKGTKNEVLFESDIKNYFLVKSKSREPLFKQKSKIYQSVNRRSIKRSLVDTKKQLNTVFTQDKQVLKALDRKLTEQFLIQFQFY